MEIEDLLIEILESFNVPVIRQGSLSDDEDYPETFFTFWNNLTEEGSFYDNENRSEMADYDVNVYSSDPSSVYTFLREAKKKLKQNGFSIPDAGHDVASDVDTHTGRGLNALYIKRL